MSDTFSIEPGGDAVPVSFLPPITPPVTGSPGPNKHLATDGAGVVDWYPDASGGLDYVYDPTAPSTVHPTYKTLTDLKAAVTAGPKRARVWFAASVTLTSSWALPEGTTFGALTQVPVTVVTVAGGVVLDNLTEITAGLVLETQNTAPCLAFSADAAASRPPAFLVTKGAALLRAGSAALYQVPDGAFAAYASQEGNNLAVAPPTSAIFEGLGAGSVIIANQVNPGAYGGLQAGDFSGLGTLNILNGMESTVMQAVDFPTLTVVNEYKANARNFGPQPSRHALIAPPGGGLPNWRALQLADIPALSTSLPRVWFVDGGVAVSGVGSVLDPFKTVGAALAAASAGDLIWIAPGTYTENLVIPVDNLTLSGAGKNSTILKAATGSTTPTVKCAPSSGSFTRLHIRNLTIQNMETGATGTGAEVGQCLYLDGNGLAVGVLAPFFTTACILENVVLDKGSSTGDGWYFRCVDKLFVSGGNGSTILGNVAGWNASGMFVNPGYGLFESTIVGNGAVGFSLSYDDTAGQIRPTNGRQGIVFANAATVYGSVSLSKAPLFSMASDTALFGDLLAPAGNLAIFTSPYHGPSIRIAGQVGSPGLPCAVNIVSPAISALAAANGAATYADFSGATLWLSSTKTFSVTGAVGAVRFSPVAIGAKFLNLPEASATVKVTANAETDLDIRKSFFRQDNLGSSGNGTIDRDSHRFGAVASPSSQTISPPFPSGATLTATSTPTTAVAVGATVTATTLTLVGSATVNAQVVRAA